MGLNEKRAIMQLSEKLPQWKQRLEAATNGAPLEVNVNWDSLAAEGRSDAYHEWERIFIAPLETVLKSICTDNLGKDAFKAKFNKVMIQNISGASFGTASITIDGNTIVLDHMLANVDDYEDRVKAWTKAIENVL